MWDASLPRRSLPAASARPGTALRRRRACRRG